MRSLKHSLVLRVIFHHRFPSKDFGLKKNLTFNKTLNNKETKSDGYKVSYLWEEILTPTSILDIIENFVLYTKETDFEWSDEKGKVVSKPKELLIFPRYHQLEVIRKLKNQVEE